MSQSIPEPVVPAQPAPVAAPATAPAAAQPAQPQAVERPEGVTDEVWNALGDPGRSALASEREARQAAERALAAARARPAPPKNPATPAAPASPPAPQVDPAAGGADIAKIVQDAVLAAMKPLQDAETERQGQAAAERIADTVLVAAKTRLVDPTDALSQIDLTSITDGAGGADPTKIATALDDLIKRKPHLGLGPREGQPGVGATAAPAASVDDQVKTILARMQGAAGIRIPSS